MIQSRDAWKSKRFHLHMTKSILFLVLQVCSVFYLATNTNGTIKGLFYHLFSVIYSSLLPPPSMFAHFRSTSEVYRACKMIRNKLVYRPSYAAIGMICLTKYRTQFKSSDRCDHDVNYLQKPLQLKDFARGRHCPV